MSAITAVPILNRAAGGALIASPSKALRDQTLQRLNGSWYPVHHALGGAEALLKLAEGNCKILFLDRRLPDLDSEELVAIIQQRFPGIQMVLLDADSGFPAEGQSRNEEQGRNGEQFGRAVANPKMSALRNCRAEE